jgi:carbon starvation protein CstA
MGGVIMISFFICLALLIGGYFVYGKVVENTFAPDDRETPAVRINDGVDYVVMPEWKLFLVQLLNIAGLGPIFGAMQGALWGPVVFLWITFGTIFAGGVHDYFSGMLSERNDGASISKRSSTATSARSSFNRISKRFFVSASSSGVPFFTYCS